MIEYPQKRGKNMNLTETMSKFRVAQQMQNLTKENFEELEITMYKEIFNSKY